ncbi:MAG TPA: PilZ domain-containing protein [Candidatus Eremiobacteraceae bacterium]|nr:PilZ domain-containing protein [Candidatus Eremiobacteraceae bacterium]
MGFFGKLFKGGRVRRPRIGARIPIEERAEMHRTKDGSAGTVILGDLSTGGARIASTMRMSKGEDLTLIVNAGRHQPFEVGCRIVTVRPRKGLHFDYGVKFVAVKPGEVERLRRFLQDRDDARRAGVEAFSKNKPR